MPIVGYNKFDDEIDRVLDFKRFLSRLENKEACIYCMHKIEHLTYRKIAELTNMSQQSVMRSCKDTSKKEKQFFK